MSNEARALVRITRIMDDFDEAARQRMTTYLVSRYGLASVRPLTAAERAARYRQNKRHETVTEKVTPFVTLNGALPPEPVTEPVTNCVTNVVTRERDVLPASRSKSSFRKETGSKATDSRGDEPEGFAEWWALYPRKKARPKAAQAYLRALRKVEPDRLIEALRAQRTEMLARMAQGDAQFVAHPTTWLNGERWNDEPDTGGLIVSPTMVKSALAAHAWLERHKAEDPQ